MDDAEIARMASFKLRECAKRMLELAEQVESNPLRDRLAVLARQLLEHARALPAGEKSKSR
jgi:hypothetical protein